MSSFPLKGMKGVLRVCGIWMSEVFELWIFEKVEVNSEFAIVFSPFEGVAGEVNANDVDGKPLNANGIVGGVDGCSCLRGVSGASFFE